MSEQQAMTFDGYVEFHRERKSDEDFVVGIDTGGTYTDGVLLEYRTREVLSSAKTLTTRENLTTGIVDVLDKLQIDDPARVKLVGISSTLATNSIAEGKAMEVGLILTGYDPELVEAYSLDSKFWTRHFAYFSGGHTAQGMEKEPLDLENIEKWVRNNQHKFDALAVSSYFSPLDPSHEERCFEAIRRISGLPAVLGHQLSTSLDSIKRAATACLNASLVAVMKEFIDAVCKALEERNITAPLMIVKGDGSLMPYTEALRKPVETILSGPAASAIGGRFLTRNDNALMIDMGGTTTDVALVTDSRIAVSDEGAHVGEVETAVKAASIRTACIGCDSRISLETGGVEVGPDRVVPLSRLASHHPEVEKEMLGVRKKRSHLMKPTDLEYWYLQKEIEPERISKDKKRQRMVEVLREGPISLTRLLKKVGVHHPVQLNADALIKRGYIEHAALTPTDLLHASGEMQKWNAKVARHATKYAARMYNREYAQFVDEVFGLIVCRITEVAIIFLAGHIAGTRLPEKIDGAWGKWLFEKMVNGPDSLLSVAITSGLPVIGIGAPAEAFVKRVAHKLNAEFLLPEQFPVANAVGAVAGSVMVNKQALIFLQETTETRSYMVQIEGTSRTFEQAEEASHWAESEVARMAMEGARAAGAREPQVNIKIVTEGALQRINAHAVGNPILSDRSLVAATT